MKYTVRNYSKGLLQAIKEKSPEERKKILKNFFALVLRNGDQGKLGSILKECEREHLKQSGLSKVVVESAEALTAGTRKEIEEILGKRILLQENINPRIIAGIKILLNDELLIDASAERQIKNLFGKS